MYYLHFGLDGPPFRFSPSAAVLYLGAAHRECLAALQWALLHDQSGFMLMIGETGTGKTTLLNAILARRLPGLQLACITNPRLSFEEIMRVVLPQLGVMTGGRGKLELIQQLERVVANRPAGHRVAIAIDEAQDLSDETLEDLRLLANRVGSQDQDLQIVLMGHPELLDRLSAHNLRQVRERISTKVSLLPLSPAESVAYVECRLEAQGGTARIFDARALRHLVKAAGGIPRRLNVLCHNALVLAYSKNASTVTPAMAREVVDEYRSILRPSSCQQRPPSRRAEHPIPPRKLLIRAAGACAAVAVLGLGSVFIPTAHDWAGAFSRTARLVAGSAPASPEGSSDSFASDENLGPAPGDASVVAMQGPAAAPAPSRTAIQIRPGDTFQVLATRYLGSKDRAGDLIKANPQIRDPNVLYVGQIVYLPSIEKNDPGEIVR